MPLKIRIIERELHLGKIYSMLLKNYLKSLYSESWHEKHNRIKIIINDLYKKYPTADFSHGDCGVLALHLIKVFGEGTVSLVITEDEPDRALHALYQSGHDYYDERGAVDGDEVKQTYEQNYSEDSIQINDGYTKKDLAYILKMTHPKLNRNQIQELI